MISGVMCDVSVWLSDVIFLDNPSTLDIITEFVHKNTAKMLFSKKTVSASDVVSQRPLPSESAFYVVPQLSCLAHATYIGATCVGE